MSQPNEVTSMVKAKDETVYIPTPVKCNREQFERNRDARRRLEILRDMRRVEEQFEWE